MKYCIKVAWGLGYINKINNWNGGYAAIDNISDKRYAKSFSLLVARKFIRCHSYFHNHLTSRYKIEVL